MLTGISASRGNVDRVSSVGQTVVATCDIRMSSMSDLSNSHRDRVAIPDRVGWKKPCE